MDYLRFQSSVCPISKFVKAASGCAQHFRIAVSISRFAASPSSRSRRPAEGIRPHLPIALGILAASGQIPAEALLHREFAGELSLTGALRPMRGAFAMACGAARQYAHAGSSLEGPSIRDADPRMPEIYLPLGSAAEAALVPGIDVFGAPDLPALCAHLSGSVDGRLTPIGGAAPDSPLRRRAPLPALVDVIGHPGARRALEVAAAGGHHLLMVGPPGAGKSMLAARLPSLLPPMTDDEALSSAAILSASMLGFSPSQWRQRPFRAPHHSSSSVALVGGRNPPQPGEITLAHLGVLLATNCPNSTGKCSKRYANRWRPAASQFRALRISPIFRRRVNWSQP
jgi:magnesium chelatase family protein